MPILFRHLFHSANDIEKPAEEVYTPDFASLFSPFIPFTKAKHEMLFRADRQENSFTVAPGQVADKIPHNHVVDTDCPLDEFSRWQNYADYRFSLKLNVVLT